MEYHQQGDVTFREIEKLPKGLKAVKRVNGRLILAEGEVTGHAHAIVEPTATMYEDEKGTLYLALEGDDPVVAKHETHGPITLTKTFYEVGKIQEYDHFQEEARNVAD